MSPLHEALLLIAPILAPLTAGLLAGVAYRSFLWQKRIVLVGAVLMVAASGLLLAALIQHGPMAVQMGSWPAPFGITLVADLLSGAFLLAASLAGLAVTIHAVATIDEGRTKYCFHAVLAILLGGLAGAFLTGDLFNLYVWFEIIVISAFALLVLGGEKAQLDGAVKYVTLNLIATTLMLMAVGMIYGATGTLNMADLALRVPEVANQGLMTAIAVLFLISMAMKAGMFPLFFWLPASYHTPPTAVMAIFAALMTKVGVYVLMRVFTLIFDGDPAVTHNLLMVFGAITLIVGVIGALAHTDIRRVLAYNVVASIGFMLVGLGTFHPVAIAGALFYALHNIILKPALFMAAGAAAQASGSWDIRAMGGIYRHHRGLALLFLIGFFALIGFPPLSGFWAKLTLLDGLLQAERTFLVAVVVIGSVLAILPASRLWASAFWSEAEPDPAGRAAWQASHGPVLFAVSLLTVLIVLIGVWPTGMAALMELAAAEMFDPAPYIEAVLGPTATDLAIGGEALPAAIAEETP